MRALLSIKPVYVNRILEGTKRFEFRKHAFGRAVDRVVIYSSSPVKKVVGEFELRGMIVGEKESVWSRCAQFSGIDKMSYDAYYANAEKACALEIGEVVQYEKPRDLYLHYGVKPPQSYCYLHK